MGESPKQQAGWAAAELAAAGLDLKLELIGKPGVVGPLVAGAKALVGLGQAVFSRNASRAADEAERTLERLAGARAEFARLRTDVDELQRRLTLAFRLIAEAGRHPSRELQDALGRFAARVLVEEIDDVDAFELAELIARMTALDYALLEAVELGQREVLRGLRHLKKIDASRDLKIDPDLQEELKEQIAKETGPNSDTLLRALRRRFPRLTTERYNRAEVRVRDSMRLIRPGPWSWTTLTGLGARVLEVTRPAEPAPAHV
jgi:hypothetical protein